MANAPASRASAIASFKKIQHRFKIHALLISCTLILRLISPQQLHQKALTSSTFPLVGNKFLQLVKRISECVNSV